MIAIITINIKDNAITPMTIYKTKDESLCESVTPVTN